MSNKSDIDLKLNLFQEKKPNKYKNFKLYENTNENFNKEFIKF